MKKYLVLFLFFVFLFLFSLVIGMKISKELSRRLEPYKIVQTYDPTSEKMVELYFDKTVYKQNDSYSLCVETYNIPKVNVTVGYYGWVRRFNDSEITGNFSGSRSITTDEKRPLCWSGIIGNRTSGYTVYQGEKPKGKYFLHVYYFFVDHKFDIPEEFDPSKMEFFVESNVIEVM